MVDMEKTTLYLPRELQRALRETARRQGRSQADVAREALERYVAADTPRPRSLGAFEQDPAHGAPVPARDARRWIRERWSEQAVGGGDARPHDSPNE